MARLWLGTKTKTWEKILDVYTEALSLYGGLIVGASVLTLTIVLMFPRIDFESTGFWKQIGISSIYIVLSFFTAWIASRVVVAFEMMSKAMRYLTYQPDKIGLQERRLIDLDKEEIIKLDPFQFKYWFNREGTYGKKLIFASFVIVFLLLLTILLIYYAA